MANCEPLFTISLANEVSTSLTLDPEPSQMDLIMDYEPEPTADWETEPATKTAL